jgi:hypothetical protein
MDIISLLMDDDYYTLSYNDRMFIIYKLGTLRGEVEGLRNQLDEAEKLIESIRKYCNDYRMIPAFQILLDKMNEWEK